MKAILAAILIASTTAAYADPICDAGVDILDSSFTLREAGVSRSAAQNMISDIVDTNATGILSRADVASLNAIVLTIVDAAYDVPDYATSIDGYRGMFFDAFLEGCEGEGV